MADSADGHDGQTLPDLPFPPLDLPPRAIYAKIVDKCGDRKYWETWAKDVAAIFARLVLRIDALLVNPDHAALGDWFDAFHEELRVSINESITRDGAIDMMAQHILTRPVFEALFEGYDFAGGNPVARALDGPPSETSGSSVSRMRFATSSLSTRVSGSGPVVWTTAGLASACSWSCTRTSS